MHLLDLKKGFSFSSSGARVFVLQQRRHWLAECFEPLVKVAERLSPDAVLCLPGFDVYLFVALKIYNTSGELNVNYPFSCVQICLQ